MVKILQALSYWHEASTLRPLSRFALAFSQYLTLKLPHTSTYNPSSKHITCPRTSHQTCARHTQLRWGQLFRRSWHCGMWHLADWHVNTCLHHLQDRQRGAGACTDHGRPPGCRSSASLDISVSEYDKLKRSLSCLWCRQRESHLSRLRRRLSLSRVVCFDSHLKTLAENHMCIGSGFCVSVTAAIRRSTTSQWHYCRAGGEKLNRWFRSPCDES